MKDDYTFFFGKTLKFLSYRPRSEFEITQYLLKKGVAQDILEKILKRLKELKFIDDEAFCRWWIEQRSGANPKGARLVRIELKKKGISQEIIEAELGETRKEDSDFELAQKIIHKRLPRLNGLSGLEIKKKLFGLLTQRGFDYEVASKAVDKAFEKE